MTAVPAPQLREPCIIARVGGERFAFATRDVEEAVDAPTVGWVPAAQDGLLGQMRHRERTVSVFDAGWLFGLDRVDRTIGTSETALMLRDGDRRMALIVDDVDDLFTIDLREVRPVPRGADADGVLHGVVFGPPALGGLLNLVRVSSLIDRATAGREESE